MKTTLCGCQAVVRQWPETAFGCQAVVKTVVIQKTTFPNYVKYAT